MSKFRPGVTAAVVLCCAAAARPRDERPKDVAQLVRKARATVQAIERTKRELAQTMDAYNALLAHGLFDRKGLYKKLQRQMAATDEERADILFRAAEMDAVAEGVFQGWAEALDATAGADLRRRSEQRLAAARANQARIRVVAGRAADLYVPVMDSLRSQVTYLRDDLNAFAIDRLKPDAAKLNRDVGELVKRLNETIGAVNAAIAALGPDGEDGVLPKVAGI